MSAAPPDPASIDRPWVASYPPGVPPSYRLPDVALTRFLDDAARDFPAGESIVTPSSTVDHSELRARVERLAASLAELGIHAGDRVLVGLPNGHALPVALFSLWRLGAVAVPIDPHLREDRIVDVVTDADVVSVIGTRRVLDALLDRVALPSVAVLVDGTEWPDQRAGRLRRFLVSPRFGPLRRATDRDDISKLGELVEAHGPRSLPSGPSPDDVAVIAYRQHAAPPRGVVLTHANLVAGAFQTRLWIPDIQAGRERVLVTEGLHTISALTMGLLTGLLSGAAVALLDDPDAAEVARSVERHGPTLYPTVPSRLEALLSEGDAARRDLTSLRVVLSVGAPLPGSIAADLERRTGGARVREAYGLAEAGALTHAQPVYGRVAARTMGLPVTSTAAAVVDPDDVGVRRPTGEPGLLIVSGPQVAAGYWRQDASSSRTFVDGWVVTDDLAVVDRHGVFRHLARAEEAIRRQGALLSPRDVEEALEHHPDVRQAGVVADADADLLVAAIVPRRRRPRPDPEDLLMHCRAHLDSPAVPDRVTLVEELPHNEAGELARDELRRDLFGR